MASQALARNTQIQAISSELKSRESLLAAVMPAATRADEAQALRLAKRVVGMAIHQIAGNSYLQDCTIPSLRSTVIRACQLGLELDPTIGHAYLVPYKNKGQRECQLIVGYKGYLRLATNSGKVSNISAEVVYDCDAFDFAYGSAPYLTHKPAPRTADAAPTWVYAVAEMVDGGRPFRVLQIADVIATGESALKKSYGKGPWKDHWEEMARKTAVRNLVKYLPQCPDAHVEATRDEARDAGVMPPAQEYDDAIEVEATVVEDEREPGQEG